jgi:hypothetical protein
MYSMRMLFIILLISIFSGSLLANELSSSDDIKSKSFKVIDQMKKWEVTPTLKKNSSYGTTEFKIFTRKDENPHHSNAMASITYMKLPKKGTSIDQMIGTIKQGLNIREWFEERSRQDAHIYGLYMPSLDRYLRIYIKEDKDSIIYTVATMRTFYIKTLAVETELMQRYLLKVIDVNNSKKTFSFIKPIINFFIPSVHAQVGIPVGIPTGLPGSAAAVSTLRSINNQITAANATANQINNFIQTNGPGVINDFNTIATFVGNNGNKFGNLATTVDGFLTNNGGKFGNMATAITSFFENNAGDLSNSIIKLADHFTNYGSIFLTAGAAGLASVSVGLLTSGIGDAARAVVDLITGKVKKEKLIARFNKARKNWAQMNKRFHELEKLLDNLFKLNDIANQFELGRATFIQLDKILPMYKRKIKSYEKKLQTMSDDEVDGKSIDCKEMYALNYKVYALQRLVGSAERITSTVKAGGRNKYNFQEEICNKLNGVLDELQVLDAEIQKARAAIIQPDMLNSWQEKWHESEEAMREDYQDKLEGSKERYDNRKEFLKNRREQQFASAEYKQVMWVSDCKEKIRVKECKRKMGPLGVICNVMSGDIQGNPLSGDSHSSESEDRSASYRFCKRKYKRLYPNSCRQIKNNGQTKLIWKGKKDQANAYYLSCKSEMVYRKAMVSAKKQLEHEKQIIKGNDPSSTVSDRGYDLHMKWMAKLMEASENMESVEELRESQGDKISRMCKAH